MPLQSSSMHHSQVPGEFYGGWPSRYRIASLISTISIDKFLVLVAIHPEYTITFIHFGNQFPLIRTLATTPAAASRETYTAQPCLGGLKESKGIHCKDLASFSHTDTRNKTAKGFIYTRQAPPRAPCYRNWPS